MKSTVKEYRIGYLLKDDEIVKSKVIYADSEDKAIALGYELLGRECIEILWISRKIKKDN